MNEIPDSALKPWRFSLVLGIVYVTLFQGWFHLGRPAIIITGLIATVALTLMLLIAAHQGYFLNRWDALLHASVVLDVLLEALLIPFHESRGFYLCAAAFALVIGGYRALLLRRRKASL